MLTEMLEKDLQEEALGQRQEREAIKGPPHGESQAADKESLHEQEDLKGFKQETKLPQVPHFTGPHFTGPAREEAPHERDQH